MSHPWTERREEWPIGDNDARSPWDVDYARIVHSSSFRRLQGKTQILNLGDSDFYRTRLTHSLEVAQIAGALVKQLAAVAEKTKHPANKFLPDRAMIQAVGLVHDLGHPPFGHGGEIALNYCMRKNGGFEGNAQTLRILSKLEKMSAAAGSNLTRRTLLATLKYPAPRARVVNEKRKPALADEPTAVRILDRKQSKPPKAFHDCETDVVDWILKAVSKSDSSEFQKTESTEDEHGFTLHKSFDCSIMDVADDVAYGVHDLEDCIALGLIEEVDFRTIVTEEASADFLDWLAWNKTDAKRNDVYEQMISALFGDGNERKRYIGRLVGYFVTSIVLQEVDGFEEPLLRYRAALPEACQILLKALKKAVYKFVIKDARVQHLEFKGQQMVVAVFEAFSTEPKALLPRYAMRDYENSNNDPRVICDHIAGMTDGFLLKTYDRLFSPRMGSVFDRL